MAITVYFTPIDPTKPINIDRRATVWTHNKSTSRDVLWQPVNAPHSGIRMDPDIYWAYPSGQ